MVPDWIICFFKISPRSVVYVDINTACVCTYIYTNLRTDEWVNKYTGKWKIEIDQETFNQSSNLFRLNAMEMLIEMLNETT